MKKIMLCVVVIFTLLLFTTGCSQSKISNYIIVEGSNFYTFESDVNAKIREGYVPIGGPGGDSNILYQAMIKEN